MANRVILALLTVFVFATGCYMDDMDTRPPAAPGDGDEFNLNSNGTQKAGTCRLSKHTGCFDGQIPSAPGLTVDGQSFMDVDEMINQFDDINAINSLQSFITDGEEYKVRLLNDVTNKNFAKDFEIYLKNEYTTRSADAFNQKFKLNEIPEGDYSIRVQKPLRLVLEKVIVTDDGEERDSKVFCATLFAEINVEVISNERLSHVFDEFELYIPKRECNVDLTR